MIAALLFVFALVMYAVDRTARLDREMDQLTWLDALLIGVAQAVALAPGVSRSGVTMVAGLAAAPRQRVGGALLVPHEHPRHRRRRRLQGPAGRPGRSASRHRRPLRRGHRRPPPSAASPPSGSCSPTCGATTSPSSSSTASPSPWRWSSSWSPACGRRPASELRVRRRYLPRAGVTRAQPLPRRPRQRSPRRPDASARAGFRARPRGRGRLLRAEHRARRALLSAAPRPARRRARRRQHLARAGRSGLRARRPPAVPSRAALPRRRRARPAGQAQPAGLQRRRRARRATTTTSSTPSSTFSATPACRRTASSARARWSSWRRCARPSRVARARRSPIATAASWRPALSSGQIVVIDPGHGGADTGCMSAGGLAEKDVALALGLRLAELLRAEGCRVRLTRERDEAVPLYERAELSQHRRRRLLHRRCTATRTRRPRRAAPPPTTSSAATTTRSTGAVWPTTSARV